MLNSEFPMTNDEPRKRGDRCVRNSTLGISKSGQQKTPSHQLRRGAEKLSRSLLIFPKAPALSWIWHLSRERRAPTGCRGVCGPVPQPLMMSSLVSTNADILMPEVAMCQTVFQKGLETFNSIRHKEDYDCD
jgi:hypothetical protein